MSHSIIAHHGGNMKVKHPVSEGPAALFHAVLALYFLVGLGFHTISAWRHWRCREHTHGDTSEGA